MEKFSLVKGYDTVSILNLIFCMDTTERMVWLDVIEVRKKTAIKIIPGLSS